MITPTATLADPLEPTPLFVSIDDIHVYEYNPRRAANQKYQDIKTSIRQRGFTGTLSITRRPRAIALAVYQGIKFLETIAVCCTSGDSFSLGEEATWGYRVLSSSLWFLLQRTVYY